MESILLDKTIQLLRESSVSRRRIAEETGLGFKWLNAVAQGAIADPGVRKIERLHSYLAGESGPNAAA